MHGYLAWLVEASITCLGETDRRYHILHDWCDVVAYCQRSNNVSASLMLLALPASLLSSSDIKVSGWSIRVHLAVFKYLFHQVERRFISGELSEFSVDAFTCHVVLR